jgi:CCR4-NOT transcriptional complex subunit CAF120
MSQFSATYRDSTTPTSSPPADQQHQDHDRKPDPNSDTAFQSSAQSYPEQEKRYSLPDSPVPSSPARADYPPPSTAENDSSTPSPSGRQRSNSRPLSMVQTYQPVVMDVNEDTIPELQPIFTFLNSHQNKLYQEGYFLKLDDQDTRMSIASRIESLDTC